MAKRHLEGKIEVVWLEVVCGFDLLIIAWLGRLTWHVTPGQLQTKYLEARLVLVVQGLQNWALDPDTGFGCAKAKLD